MRTPPPELLAVFLAAAESPSLFEAGRRAGLSQPAVSVRLKRLENLLDVPLFQTDGRRKKLTPYGRRLAEAARQGLEDLDLRWETAIRELRDPRRLVIRIASRHELHRMILDRLSFPGRIQLQALTSHEATEAVLHGRVDIAVSHEKPDSSELIARKLLARGAVFAVHRRWVRGKLDPLDPDFLRKTPALAYKPELPMLGPWVRSRGVDPASLQLRVIAEDWNLLHDLAARGEGYAILPDLTEEEDTRLSHRDLLTVKLPTAVMPALTYYAIYRRTLVKLPAFRDVFGAAAGQSK